MFFIGNFCNRMYYCSYIKKSIGQARELYRLREIFSKYEKQKFKDVFLLKRIHLKIRSLLKEKNCVFFKSAVVLVGRSASKLAILSIRSFVRSFVRLFVRPFLRSHCQLVSLACFALLALSSRLSRSRTL